MIVANDEINSVVANALKTGELITFLTGAGVSLESHIPTFRGAEGYWTIGSIQYMPSEIASLAMLRKMPKEVWRWFLFRRGVCMDSQPNAGHIAIAEIDHLLGNRFRLITQNVDGLHCRAGNSSMHLYQVHGNIHYMRCMNGCGDSLYPIPAELVLKARDDDLTDDQWQQLQCPLCKTLARPHVLLWDEYYDEVLYRYYSSIAAASQSGLLVMAGTSGSTNCPNQVANAVLERGATVVDINTQSSALSMLALRTDGGAFWKGDSATFLSRLAEVFKDQLSG